MKTMIQIFWFVLSVMPVSANKPDAFDDAIQKLFEGATGRECLFRHLEDRNKRIGDQDHWVSLTGQHYGLILQFGEKAKVLFPDGESWVETPAGARIPLLFKLMDAKALPGYWRVCFSQPHVMGKGVYQYRLSLLLNGKKQTVNHKLDFDSRKAAPNEMGNVQVGG